MRQRIILLLMYCFLIIKSDAMDDKIIWPSIKIQTHINGELVSLYTPRAHKFFKDSIFEQWKMVLSKKEQMHIREYLKDKRVCAVANVYKSERPYTTKLTKLIYKKKLPATRVKLCLKAPEKPIFEKEFSLQTQQQPRSRKLSFRCLGYE